MKEKIELLKNQIEDLKNIPRNQFGYSVTGVQAWISATSSILERIFGKKSTKIKEIKSIKDKLINNISGESYYHFNDVNIMGKSIINAAINELDKLGIPETVYNGKKESINLTLIQTQSNSQTTHIEIITKVLQDELNGNQLKELQTILDSKEEKEKKKSNLIEKLKDFGINTLSGIISGVLTNMTQGQ